MMTNFTRSELRKISAVLSKRQDEMHDIIESCSASDVERKFAKLEHEYMASLIAKLNRVAYMDRETKRISVTGF